MHVSELHKIIKDEFSSVRIQISVLTDQQKSLNDNVNQRLPIIERGLADVRSTLYDPTTGLQKQVTLIGARQNSCQKQMDPGNLSDRRANWIAGGALIVAFLTMILMLTQLGGCKHMPDNTQTLHMDNMKEVDTLTEHRELVKEITALVKDIGRNARIEVTGDRTYEIEDDGSIYMLHGGERRPVSRWRKRDEWQYFQEDIEHNRLKQRLEALR